MGDPPADIAEATPELGHAETGLARVFVADPAHHPTSGIMHMPSRKPFAKKRRKYSPSGLRNFVIISCLCMPDVNVLKPN
jgi:hypothetical protein